MQQHCPHINRLTRTSTQPNVVTVVKLAMAMVMIHRQERKTVKPGIKHAQNVTKRTTSLTCVNPNLKNRVKTKDADESSSVYHQMCSVSISASKTGRRMIILDHHIFDDEKGWVARRSAPQPTVSLIARASTTDYEELGIDSTHRHARPHSL